MVGASGLAFALVAALPALAAGIPRQDDKAPIKLEVPQHPRIRSRVVDSAFVSYSFEFQEMADFGGNLSHPNLYTHQMAKNLKDLSGSYPMFRVGGMPQDQSYWDPTLETATRIIPGDRPEYPLAVYFGPVFLESCQALPEEMKVVWGLTMGEPNDAGFHEVMTQGKEVWAALKDRLYALEVGNEPEYFPNINIREPGYSVEQYAKEWKNLTNALTKTLPDLPTKVWQAGALQSPWPGNPFNVTRALDLGVDEAGRILTMSDHQYMGGGDCTVETVLNRTVMHEKMWPRKALGDDMVARGYEYVVGETNTCFGHGRAGVSDAYASGLWAADYALYSASLNISRIWFHQGTVFRYSAFQPIHINGRAPYAKPLYYGNLLTAEAFAGGSKSVLSLINETYIAAYGVYERPPKGSGNCKPKLTHLAVFDKTAYDPTVHGERGYTTVQLPDVAHNARVKRLTGPSVHALLGVTYGGQSVGPDGTLEGEEVVERPKDGAIEIGQAEGLLIAIE